jgi:DNA (cytosine-5)-methyltransferase 1
MITHYDLFAGIGGFSLALEEVFSEEIKHIFCEWESFPTAVLKKHWPEAIYYGDIADLVADTEREGRTGSLRQAEGRNRLRGGNGSKQEPDWTVLTGGFPCQPFSAAGRRKGTADDRYKWPEMFAVIKNVRPDWVIAENVRGLVTWNEGMVLEQVCSDLEAEGYEVQPLIIPAVAVNAPHRRDRVWIIANHRSEELGGIPQQSRQTDTEDRASDRAITDTNGRQGRPGDVAKPAQEKKLERSTDSSNVTNPRPQRRQTGSSQSVRPEKLQPERQDYQYPDWQRNWQEVAFATCDDSVDDGLPRTVDGVPYSRAKWRKDSLKAYGNAIVPQVAMEIFRAIKEAYDQS